MRPIAAICCFLLVLVGCASVSDVVPTGPNTFLVAAHGIDGNGSGAAQKALALNAANAYCQARAKQMQVFSVQSVEPFFGRPPSADVQFRCE